MSTLYIDHRIFGIVHNTLFSGNQNLVNMKNGMYGSISINNDITKYSRLLSMAQAANRRSYRIRYKRDGAYIPTVLHDTTVKCSYIQLLKHIECILYNTDETGYKGARYRTVLAELKEAIKTMIIHTSEDYNNAKWGDV